MSIIDIAHRRAMKKFITRWKKWPSGFDFMVPDYRKDEFEAELKQFGLVFCTPAAADAGFAKKRISLWQRIKTLNFKKIAGWEIVGVGVEDLVREDFIQPDRMYETRYVECYSVAPTKELLTERERIR